MVFEAEFEQVHGFDHTLHRHKNVLVHEFDEAPLILVRVARAVDDAHLLDEGRLSRLTRPCGRASVVAATGRQVLTKQQELQFATSIPFVFPQLPFDLLIDPLLLFRLLTEAAGHYARQNRGRRVSSRLRVW